MFNLSKIAQEVSGGDSSAIDTMYDTGHLLNITKSLTDEGQDYLDSQRGTPDSEFDPKDLNDPEQQAMAARMVDVLTLQNVFQYLNSQGQIGRTAWHALVDELAASEVATDNNFRNVATEIAENPQLRSMEPQALAKAKYNVQNGPLGPVIQRILSNLRGQQQGNTLVQQMGVARTAQVQPLKTNIQDKGIFISQYLSDLLSHKGDKGPEDARSERAKAAILLMVSPAAHEEANSPLEEIQGLSGTIDEHRAEELLGYVFDNWIAPAAVENDMQADPQSRMEPVMSEKNPKGIIKHDLSDQVLNNKSAMVKTAADQFGQQYLLYGPTEKRICPKLRGKGGGVPGSGDVVSEYICRHHCLDGIVIDDHKTVCGEALWRANVMDKQSREYVDGDGNIRGGYIEKRFEVNHNVPEENKMRLKPGETRKVRPPEWGNMESRMQAMRQAEGEKRGYRPETNTGDPFKWCTDVDQNNVNQTQAERDRREEASGHKLVEYTDKNKQENKPKIASACSCGSDCNCGGSCSCGPNCPCKKNSKKAFNLGKIKTATSIDEITTTYKQLQETINEDDEINTLEAQPKEMERLEQIKEKATRRKPYNLAKKEKGVTYKGEHFDYNPWAVCNKSTGGKGEAGEDKFERCVQHVKDESRGKKKKDAKEAGTFNLRNQKIAQMEMPGTLANPQPKPMTGPRGPVGPDNPASDDLGLSPDFDSFNEEHDNPRIKDNSQLVEEIIDSTLSVGDRDNMIRLLNRQLKESPQMSSHDWDEVMTEVNNELIEEGMPEITISEFDYMKGFTQKRIPKLHPESFASNTKKKIW